MLFRPPTSAKTQAPGMRCSFSPPAGSAIINSMHCSTYILSVNCSENYLYHLEPLNSLHSNKYTPYYYYHIPLLRAHRARGCNEEIWEGKVTIWIIRCWLHAMEWGCEGTRWRRGINNYEVIIARRVTPQSTQRAQSLEAFSNKLLRSNGVYHLRFKLPGLIILAEASVYGILCFRCNNYIMRFLCGEKYPVRILLVFAWEHVVARIYYSSFCAPNVQ